MFFEVGVLKNFPIFRGKHLYCLHKTIKFETLTQLTCFIFLLGVGEMLWGYRECWGLGPGGGGWGGLWGGMLFTGGPGRGVCSGAGRSVVLGVARKYFRLIFNCY